MEVFPTPPLPPTKITGVLLLLSCLFAAMIDAISSTNGRNEYSLVDVDVNENCKVAGDEMEDRPTIRLAAILLTCLLFLVYGGGEFKGI